MIPEVEAPPSRVFSLGRSFTVLATLLRVFLRLLLLLAVADIVLRVVGINGIDAAIANQDQNWEVGFDRASRLSSVAWIALFLIAGVLWVIWQYRLAAAAPRAALRRSPGMHVASWILPIVAIWFPVQNIRDLWDNYVGERRQSIVGLWWLTWIVSNVIGYAALRSTRVHSVESFKTEQTMLLLIRAFQLASCVLALVVVRTLTRAALRMEKSYAAQAAVEVSP